MSVVVDALVNKNYEVICFRFIIGACAVFTSVIVSATEKDEKSVRRASFDHRHEPEVTTPSSSSSSILNNSVISVI